MWLVIVELVALVLNIVITGVNISVFTSVYKKLARKGGKK